jgi:hypothetical protein
MSLHDLDDMRRYLAALTEPELVSFTRHALTDLERYCPDRLDATVAWAVLVLASEERERREGAAGDAPEVRRLPRTT